MAGGEAGYIVPQPGNSSITFGGEYDGILSRHDETNEQYKYVNVHPFINDGWGGDTWKYRFAWTFPISYSPWNKDVLYCTSNHVHRSTNGGMSWETISPDLTRDDPSKQLQSGGIITPDNTGAEIYCTIYAFAESRVQQGLLWAGSDDGLVHVSNDNGETWNKVTPQGLPEWTTISILEPSPHDAGTCFISAHRYRLDDTKPYLYRTTDFGKTWTKITNGIGAGDYARCVREDPNRKGLLYCGTETGVYVSFNNGDSWQGMRLNLPVTPVWDMQVKKDLRELVVATHGRSFWVLDDLSPLYQLDNTVANSAHHLFQPNTAIRMDGRQVSEERAAETQLEEGTNAPNGAIIYYYLKNAAKDEVKLVFYLLNGDSIISFSSKTKPDGKPFVKEDDTEFFQHKKPSSREQLNTKAGMHRFVWNLNYPAATLPEDAYWAPGQLRGPAALPGNYTVKLFVDGKEQGTQNFPIQLNPKVNTSEKDLMAQFNLALQINRKQDELIKKVLQIRGVKKQVQDFLGSFSDSTQVSDLKKLSKPLIDSLSAIEGTLINSKIKTYLDPLRYPNQILERYGYLNDFVNSSDSPPAQQMVEVFNELNKHFALESKRLDNVFETLVPAFNKAVEAKQLKVVDPQRAVKKE
ncbi:MAG: hypothetical protein SH856_00705 [Flavobacteriales bacterium]|nr:hypothetical protein [Flavobacteriales bacterium]